MLDENRLLGYRSARISDRGLYARLPDPLKIPCRCTTSRSGRRNSCVPESLTAPLSRSSGRPTWRQGKARQNIRVASGSFAVPQEPSDSYAAEFSGSDSADGKVGFGGALVNVLNILSGVGLLSVPYALKKAGWVGLGVLWLLGIVTNYTGKVLVECCEEVAARRKAANDPNTSMVGYEDIGEAAYGSFGKKLVSTTMYTELLGICALLFILEGENMYKLFGTLLAPTADTYILIAAACMIPTVWLPDLKALSLLGVFGFAATLTVAATIGYTFLAREFVQGAATQMANWSQVPVVFGILAFVYAGHGVFPAIQASMKKPKDFPKATSSSSLDEYQSTIVGTRVTQLDGKCNLAILGNRQAVMSGGISVGHVVAESGRLQVLNAAYAVVALLCTFLGATGYLMYGSNVLDVITFNLPAGLPATLCASIILINPIAKLALTMEPVASAATTAVTSNTKGMSEGWRRILVRTAMALGCLGTACYVPFLALVMSLIGSLLTIATAIILPVAIHSKLFKGRLSQRQVAWNLFVLAIGVACAMSGTTSSILAILRQSSS